VGLLLEYNGKIYIGLDSHVGFPYGRAQSALRNAFLLFSLYCIPLGLIIQSKLGLLLEYREEEDGFYPREGLIL